jgi:carbonic anhydrase/acetyltransferase-like protein (isoleucine patch superfamily)
VDPSAKLVGPVRVCAGATIGPGITVGPNVVVGVGAQVFRSLANTIVWADALVVGGDMVLPNAESFGNGQVITP